MFNGNLLLNDDKFIEIAKQFVLYDKQNIAKDEKYKLSMMPIKIVSISIFHK